MKRQIPVCYIVGLKNGICKLEIIIYGYFLCWQQILIKILEIIKNSPKISRDIWGNWVKFVNTKNSPSKIEESMKNDGENY